jgi:hypothetical protein
VPEGEQLFFPVINQINFNTPRVCGQNGKNLTVSDLRALSAAFIDGAVNLSVTLDGKTITMQRVQSVAFAVAVPQDNFFVSPCADLGGFPAGIYSPAVDDGFYVLLNPLNRGTHHLHFHAERPEQDPTMSFILDVTYTLKVVPILLK